MYCIAPEDCFLAVPVKEHGDEADRPGEDSNTFDNDSNKVRLSYLFCS